MKLNNIKTTVSKMTGRTGLLARKYSPEILLVVGVTGVVGGAVMACKATLRAEEVLIAHSNKLDTINRVVEEELRKPDGEYIYTKQDQKKDLTITYIQTGLEFMKLYGPSVAIGVGGIFCIIGGQGILKKRNLALIAAYNTVQEGFMAYRKRVVEEYGEEKDYMYKNGLRAEMVSTTEVGTDGKTKKVKTQQLIADPNDHSKYARFFDEGCAEWSKTPEYNMMFLRAQQSYFNDMLKSKGHVFLNEVYDALGIQRSQAGQIVGWVLSKDSDNFVDFGIYDQAKTATRDFVNGYEPVILLDFNVDGIIFDKI